MIKYIVFFLTSTLLLVSCNTGPSYANKADEEICQCYIDSIENFEEIMAAEIEYLSENDFLDDANIEEMVDLMQRFQYKQIELLDNPNVFDDWNEKIQFEKVMNCAKPYIESDPLVGKTIDEVDYIPFKKHNLTYFKNEMTHAMYVWGNLKHQEWLRPFIIHATYLIYKEYLRVTNND